jgi:hypothetical protein
MGNTTKRDKVDEPISMTDLLSEVFALGFDEAVKGPFKDADDALDDKDVIKKMDALHERFGNQVIASLEVQLDMSEDDDDDDDDSK